MKEFVFICEKDTGWGTLGTETSIVASSYDEARGLCPGGYKIMDVRETDETEISIEVRP